MSTSSPMTSKQQSREIQPNHLSLCDAQFSPLANRSVDQVRDMAIRKIGAEIYIFRQQMLQALGGGETPSFERLAAYKNHFFHLVGEFAPSRIHYPEMYEHSPMTIMKRLTSDFIQCFTKEDRGVSALGELTEEYFATLEPIYTKLNQETVLSHLPSAGELGLSIIEFDTDFSGPSDAILSSIEQVEKKLLVDLTIEKPQEGFGSYLSVAELREILQRRQSKIFIALVGREICGFYLPLLNPESVKTYPSAHFNDLVRDGILKRDCNPGMAIIVGNTREGRLPMARTGIHLYKVFDQLIISSAGRVGLDLLIGAVREGQNANTSIRAHRRLGWETTGHTFLSADGKTPYRTILRRISIDEIISAAHQSVGLGTHFEPYHDSTSISDSRIETIQERIGYEQAEEECRAFFGTRNSRIQIRSMHGCYGFLIMMIEGTKHYGIIFSLEQIRPGLDYWVYLQSTSGDNKGSLQQQLRRIADEMRLFS